MLRRFALVAILVFHSAVAFAADVSREVFPLERGGVQLHLECYQVGEGEKTPLLMVHGLTYSSHEFDVDYGDYSLARFFANSGYSVWLLDIAGYGQSQKVQDGFMPNSDYAAEDIAVAAKRILELTKAKKLNVLGWSWGTVTGGRFAAKYPGLVDKLVLYAPIVAGLAKVDVTAPFNKNTWAHAASDFQVKADKTIDHDTVEAPVAATFLANCWRYDGEGSPNGGRRDLLVDPSERLIPTEKIKAATLLIVGGKDEYVTAALCQEALKTLPAESELKVIEGGAHAMMMEKPYYKTFREAVLDFLKK
ncbi:MAG: alpha/beta hydrolase [Synergistaceae bacterium]|jgi:pimeloyl-ACP methyl ester carboxylesterase|nr:alpha/beta hydrolase [Synergistaceae bacterium]